MNRITKSYLLSGLIVLTMVACFAFPRPKYESQMILQKLDIPHTLEKWRSVPLDAKFKETNDDRYNFLSDAFTRVYGTRDKRSLLFVALDAGNFHHPRLCYGGSGFHSKDLEETELNTAGQNFRAKTFLAQKKGEAVVVIYWMCINKHRVNWTDQKFSQFWNSLFNKKQAGLMLRVDVPVTDGKTAEAVEYGQRFIRDLSSEMSASDQEWMFGKDQTKDLRHQTAD